MPTQRQEQQRNKILEDLQKKQQLLKQQSISGQSSTGVAMASNSSATPTPSSTTGPAVGQTTAAALDTASTSGPISSSQRSALNHANNNSFGFFIPQDSSFGNLILPVLPRF
ncbi:unnamed protein product [Medioppia subpectinata]|uniref:SOSS complex subunit C homolog n=1 Tax=Medioppia subpectinata TaxID=1979941 RepID=A0A7R9Q2R9_9ACAR|nr:unnamed protein product [Medioppia subpectinata]CAG2109711.1 unnamed protein product [Medioppia subpectinata]